MSPLTVVTTIFNPRRFQSRIRLYRQFQAYLALSGVRLVTVEVAFGERPFEISGKDVINLRSQCEIWHKERALNIGIKYALESDPTCKYIAWIDADVAFTKTNWAEETVHALQHYKVVQMYGNTVFLNAKDEATWTCESAMKGFIDKGYHQEPPIDSRYLGMGHPGLAWACTADAWRNLEGLFDVCVAGSGDLLMAWALRGRWRQYLGPHPDHLTPGFLNAMQIWARRCDLHIQQNIGYVPGCVFHYWHGKSEQRGYEKRWDIINFHKFDPAQDLIVDLNGLYGWRPGHKPKLEQDLRLSAASRNEDSID